MQRPRRTLAHVEPGLLAWTLSKPSLLPSHAAAGVLAKHDTHVQYDTHGVIGSQGQLMLPTKISFGILAVEKVPGAMYLRWDVLNSRSTIVMLIFTRADIFTAFTQCTADVMKDGSIKSRPLI